MQREVRKTVSVVFSDVAGSTALAEQLDPESLRRAMTRYFEVASLVHQRHGGVVEKFIGDAVMAVFGIPHLHEDDALRAVRAAFQLREQVAALNRELERELGVALHVRTGVNTGLVLAGDEHEGHGFVGGDTVNVAARLERAAGAGEVLLGEATHRLVADAVQVVPVTPFVPRGKTAPIAAFRLVGVTAGAAGLARRMDTPLVGRARELAALDAVLDRAADGPACELVTVVGDAGVGKSRLLHAFADRAGQRALVLFGRCPPHGLPATAEVVGQLVAQATAAAGRPPAGPRPRPGDGSDPQALFRGVRLLLERLARARPVVVVVDDAHLAEQLLLDLVEYLHAFTGKAAVLLVVAARRELLAHRGGWSARAAGSVLDLEPLTEAEAAELAASLRGPGRLPAGAARKVAAWAEGNPLFVEQLLRQVTELHGPGQRWTGDLGPVPPAVEALVAVELDRLTAEERAVLELASVVGRVFDWASVAALAPPRLRPRVGGVLLALARRDLVRASRCREDAFAFRHRLLRDAAYQAIPKRERAILHVRAAERLAEGAGASAEDDETVGRHLGQAYRYLAQLAGDEPLPPIPAIRPPGRAPVGAST
jgi:class 3 adenylate cyclase